MKAAVLISGYLRTLKSNLENVKKELLDRFEKCDVYLHITSNEKSEDRYFNPFTDREIEEIKSFLSPRVVIEESNFSISSDKRANDLINSWIKYRKLYSAMRETEAIEGCYDIVIKHRPDLNFMSKIPYELTQSSSDCVFLPVDSKIDISKLRTSDDKHICDTFAFGSSSAMSNYFPTLDEVVEAISNHGTIPETFLYHYLTEKRVSYRQLDIEYSVLLSSCNVFAIAGDSGSGKSTLASLLKSNFADSFLLECDRYHKWERGDEMWKKMTHLNPDSNYISKMRSDIFDLKVGNDVYHVNYDHKTGKFTEDELIPSSNNLIVCGLHSLYVDSDRVYNGSIFMDTDETLRKKWKIRRDMLKRGYSLEKILEQIESRENDYRKYIVPQREKADIVVNFYTDEVFSPDKISLPDRVGLRIFINSSCDSKETVSKLEKIARGTFRVGVSKQHHIIEFPICNELEYSKEKANEFYSYILVTVMNTKRLKA